MTNDWVPQFTRVGFEKSRIPDHLYEMILTEYEEMKNTPTTPEVCEPVISNSSQPKSFNFLIFIPFNLSERHKLSENL